MAGGLQGADLAQLQHLVQQLGGPFQSELQSTLNGMNQKVQASSSYWVARNADQFDVVLHIDRTQAVEPLEPWSVDEADLPETYPTAL